MRQLRLPLLAALLATSVLGMNAPGAPASAETLPDALRDTYVQSPRLDAERARLRSTDELLPQALAGWRPQIRALGGAALAWEHDDDKTRGRGTADDENDRNADRLNQLNGRLTATQSLYAGGETVAGTRRAENQVLSGRSRLAGAEQDVLLDVVEAYASVVRARNVLRYATGNRERLQRYQAGAKERFRVAELTLTDVAQADSRVAGADADLARAESELEAALAEFERAVGRPPGDLQPAGLAPELPSSLDEAMAQAPTHPRVLQASYDLEAQRDQVRVDEAQLLPDLNLVGELSRQRQPSENTDLRDDASIGAEIVIPIYQRGTEYSRIRQSKQGAIQRRYELTDAERTVRREIATSYDALQAVRRQIASLDLQIAASQTALSGTREEALAGARTVLDVLNAELELFTAQIRRERAVEQEVVASYRLRAAVGGLSLAGLGIGDESYDPAAYYHDVRNKWFGLSVTDPAATPAGKPAN